MDVDLFGLRDKPALVVGGGAGIGRASALMLAQVGARVAVADMDTERAMSTAKEIEALGSRAIALEADVTDRGQAEGLVAATAEEFGGIEVVINMVGMAGWYTLFEVEDDDWEIDFARNLKHHLYVGRAAARRMIDQGTGGRIAVVASVSGLYGAPNHGAYGAAKAGVMALVRTMAQEWGPSGIRVNGVAPDMIATPRLVLQSEARGHDLDEDAVQDGAPLGRYGTPDEIAGPLVFLVSNLSSFMTGETLVVDGGQRAAFPHGQAQRQQRGNLTERPKS